MLRDVSPDTLNRATLFHEHLSFEWARVAPQSNRSGPAKDAAPVLEQLDVAAAEGVGCIVDAGTNDVGRDNALLRQIASRTSVHIVACGGLYMERTYPQDVAAKSEDQIADDLVSDANAARYGAFGEIGETPNAAMSAAERKVFRAVGKAHLRSTFRSSRTTPTAPDPTCRRTPASGNSTRSSRLASAPDAWRLATVAASTIRPPKSSKQIAKRGAYVGFDRVTGGLVPDDKKVAMILAFLDAGYVDRLLLSSDYNFTARSDARPGYGITLTVFVPKLRKAGVTDEMLRRITIDNPAPISRVRASFITPNLIRAPTPNLQRVGSWSLGIGSWEFVYCRA